MAWCNCAPKVSDFNVDVQGFGGLTLGTNADLLVNPGAEKKSSPLTPIPLAEDDDYDPRKPEFIIQASPEEAGAKDVGLVRQQISHLKSMLVRRKEQADRTPDAIIDHYEKVLEELGHVLEPEEQSDTILSPMTSPKVRRKLFADLSGETSLVSLPRLPPSPVRSKCGRFSRTGTPDRATALPKKSSPSAPRQGCSGTLFPPVSPTVGRLPDNANRSFGISSSKCDSPSIASEGKVSSLALSSTQSPQNANPSKITLPRESGHVQSFPSPRSQGIKMKKPYLKSAIPRDDCSGSKFNFRFCQGDTARMLMRNVRVSTLLDRIQDHLQNFTFTGLPFVDNRAETAASDTSETSYAVL